MLPDKEHENSELMCCGVFVFLLKGVLGKGNCFEEMLQLNNLTVLVTFVSFIYVQSTPLLYFCTQHRRSTMYLLMYRVHTFYSLQYGHNINIR